MKWDDVCLDKLVENSIINKGQINDLLFGIKELSGKLDTLIALKQVELSVLQQRPQPPQQTDKS